MVAMQSAELMSEAGFPRTAVRAVRHMHERWDGAGGPDGLKDAGIPLGAQIIAVADALDHYVSAWLQAGLNADNAVDRAVHLVTVQQEQLFSPSVVGAVHRQTELIRETIAETLTEPVQPSLTTASYVSSLSEVPFQAA
jgi:response regulator RpfG family c-di-GMP phosphodiesterase